MCHANQSALESEFGSYKFEENEEMNWYSTTLARLALLRQNKTMKFAQTSNCNKSLVHQKSAECWNEKLKTQHSLRIYFVALLKYYEQQCDSTENDLFIVPQNQNSYRFSF